MQATFLCLAYNLLEAKSLLLEKEHGVKNVAELDRKRKRLDREKNNAKHPLPQLYVRLQRLTQHSVKFTRWIHHHLWKETSLNEALPQLRVLYEKL